MVKQNPHKIESVGSIPIRPTKECCTVSPRKGWENQFH